MTTLSLILIAMLGFLFALIVWAIIGTIRENRAINRGEIPCRQCFACTRYWMFEDSKKNLNVVGLRRYIEMNEIEICEYRRKELYGCRFKREEGNMGAVLGHAERGITVSKAITILSVHAQNAIGMATIGNDRAYEEYLALEMGIQALQKQLVDRVPCERCDSAPPLSRHCPNCGRRLPEANQNGTL